MRLYRLSLLSILFCLLGLLGLIAVTINTLDQVVDKQTEVAELLQLSKRIDDFIMATQGVLTMGADAGVWRTYVAEARTLQDSLPELGSEGRRAAYRIQLTLESVTNALQAEGQRDIAALELPERSRILMSHVSGQTAILGNALEEMLGQRQQTISRDSRSLILILGASALLFGLLSMASFWLIHHRIAGPARNLSRTLDEVRAGNIDARVPVQGRDELSRVALTMNALLDERQAADREVADRETRLQGALAELETIRDQLLRAQHIANMGSWEYDQARGGLECSDQMLSILGVRREEFGGSIENLLARIHPDDLAQVQQARQAWHEQGGDLDVECRMLRPDGGVRWVHVRAHVSAGTTANEGRSTGVLQDISERRSQELRLLQLKRLVEASSDLCGAINDSYQYLWVNPAYAAWFGKSPDEIEGRYTHEVMSESHFRDFVQPNLDRCLSMGELRFEVERDHPTLGRRYMLIRYYPIDIRGEKRRHIGFLITDITESRLMLEELKAKEQALRRSNEALVHSYKSRQALINSLPAHIALLDQSGTIIDTNEQWRHYGVLNRYQGEDLGLRRNYLEVCDQASGDKSEEAAAVADGLRGVLSGQAEFFSMEYPCHTPDQKHWYRVTFNRLLEDSSIPGAVVATHVDITERKLAELQLERLAFEDPLTGQLSRIGFVRRLQDQLDSQPWPEHGIVLLLDVVKQREINEVYGYETGDRLLIELGRRLQVNADEQGLVGRAGGNAFLLFIKGQAGQELKDSLQHLRSVVDQPFNLGGIEVELSVWIGLTRLGERAPRAAEDLVREAELALFEHRGSNREHVPWMVYSPELDARASEGIRLTRELRQALESDQFELHFQPKVNLADGSLVAAEALIRWHHPERGLQPPGTFIPVAEQTQLIGPIGDWALRAACRQLRDWQAAGLAIVRVSVNVSLVQLALGDFPAKVRDALKTFGIPASALSLEITESAFERRPEQLLAQLNELHEMGVLLSLDDFGTGYSSLMHLQRYPFDEIKIDRAFVSKVLDEELSQNIVRTVVDVAHVLGAEVVAEGIESHQIAQALIDMGVRIGQGFYYSMPLEAEDFRWLLEQRSRLPLSMAGASN